jgi:hypothetical protein
MMKGETFLCEDAGLFGLPLSYSAVAASPEGVIVYKVLLSQVFEIWPIECQNEVKLRVLDKYKWFYKRVLTIESNLSDKTY